MASSQVARSPKFYVFALGSLAVAAASVVYFHYARNQDVAAVREVRAAVAERGPRIEVVTTAAGPTIRTIKVLGDVRSASSATLYSKVAGYLKVVHVDKGDKVEAGQILAEIESPELDQQYAAAAADLVNKRRNLDRIRGLYEKGNSTQVALYQAETESSVAENNVAVLATNKSYQTVRSPFTGRVTARFADPGALIGNAQTNYVSALPMLTISDDNKIRVYVYLQQTGDPRVERFMTDVTAVVDEASRVFKGTSTEGEIKRWGEKISAANFLRLLFEHVNKQFADGLTLDLGILDAIERLEEGLGCVNVHTRDVIALAEHRHDLLRLGEPHQSMIDQYAGELIADSLVDQDRSDCRVNATRETANHATFADLLANLFDRLVPESAHRPVAGEPGNLAHEIAQKRCPMRRMHDFEMELGGVEFASVIADNGDRGVRRCA